MEDVKEWRERMRQQRAGHHGINAWKCPLCGLNTVCIDVDPGVTPMLLACRRTPGCKGLAVSSGYPHQYPPEHIVANLEWEWAIPTRKQYMRLDPAMKEHIDKGGLMLQPRTDRPSAYLEAGD